MSWESIPSEALAALAALLGAKCISIARLQPESGQGGNEAQPALNWYFSPTDDWWPLLTKPWRDRIAT